MITPASWKVAAEFTVTAIDDSLQEGRQEYPVAHTITSSDSDYDGFTVSDVAVVVTDNDVASVAIAPSLVKPAEGGSATYSIFLTTQPTEDVVVSLNLTQAAAIAAAMGDDTVSLSPSTSLTFFAATRLITTSTPQTVTVSAVNRLDRRSALGYYRGLLLHIAVSSSDT